MKGRIAALRRLLVPEAAGGGIVAAAPTATLRALARRFWPYARPYRGWFALTLVLIVAGAAIETGQVWVFKHLVDDVLVPRDFGPFGVIVVVYLGLAVVDGLVGFFDDYLSAWVGERFLLRVRTDVFAHVQRLSVGFLEGRRLGDVISRLTGDVQAIEELVLSGVADALSHVVRLLFFCGALFFIDPLMAGVSLVVAPLFWVLARWFSRRIKVASREKRRRSGSIATVAEEALANAALVQAHNREEHEIARFEREGQGALAAQLASVRLQALFGPAVNLVELVGALAVIALGTWQLSRGRISLGELLAFLTFLTQLYSPIRGLSRLTNVLFAASASAERIVELLDEKPLVSDRPDARPLTHASGRLELDDVTFTYPGTSTPAVRGVSLTAAPGETVALVGASGAGKSTIAKLALRFYDPSAGAVRLDGHDLRDVRLHDLREQVAVLLQETLMFHGSIRENIAYGRPDATADEIEAAARAADAHDFVVALPDGYDTVAGERGRRLSGGQRQRVAIARALLRDAPVLVLDEPTTGLDVESADRVLEPLRRLMSGRTTIVIAHDLLTVRDADRIVVLDAGTVAEHGTHDELLARGGRYASLWAARAEARTEAPA